MAKLSWISDKTLEAIGAALRAATDPRTGDAELGRAAVVAVENHFRGTARLQAYDTFKEMMPEVRKAAKGEAVNRPALAARVAELDAID